MAGNNDTVSPMLSVTAKNIPNPPTKGVAALCTFLLLGLSTKPMDMAIFLNTGINNKLSKKEVSMENKMSKCMIKMY